MSEDMSEESMYEMMKAMKDRYSGDEHFNESYARYLVCTILKMAERKKINKMG